MSMKPKQQNIPWGLVLLIVTAGVVLLRLLVWKFFIGAGTMIKEDLSNLIVASCQLALGAGYGVLALRRRVSLAATGFEWPLGILLAVSAVSLCYTVDFSVSIRVWLALAGSIAMFYVLANTLTDIGRIRWFLLFILGCALVTSVYGIQEFFILSARPPQPGDAEIAESNNSLYYILVNRRVTSFLGWPNSLAGYLMLILPFAGLLIAALKSTWQRCVLGLVFATLVGCLLVTFSFLGWLGFLAAAALWLPLMVRRFMPRMDVRTRIFLAVLAAGFVGLFIVVILRKNFASSISPRLEYYRQAWQLIQARPWEGYGYGGFGFAARPMVVSMGAFTNYVHNVYLQWWVECGVLGLAGIAGLVGVFAVAARRVLEFFKEGESGFISLAVVWGLTAFFIDNISSFTFTKPNIAVHGWAMLGVFAALYRQSRRGAVVNHQGWRLPAAVTLVCTGALVLSLALCLGISCLQAGVQAINAGKVDEAGRLFVRGSLIDPWSASYPLAAGDAAAGLFSASHLESHLRLAETNYLEAVRREPVIYNGHLMLSRVYTVFGERDKVLSYAREARRLSPYEYDRDMERMTRYQNSAQK